MAEFDPLTSYKGASGDIIVIKDMESPVLVGVYKFFLNHYRVLEKMLEDPRVKDPILPVYIKRFAQVRDLLKEEIRVRKLKMKYFV